MTLLRPLLKLLTSHQERHLLDRREESRCSLISRYRGSRRHHPGCRCDLARVNYLSISSHKQCCTSQETPKNVQALSTGPGGCPEIPGGAAKQVLLVANGKGFRLQQYARSGVEATRPASHPGLRDLGTMKQR